MQGNINQKNWEAVLISKNIEYYNDIKKKQNMLYTIKENYHEYLYLTHTYTYAHISYISKYMR